MITIFIFYENLKYISQISHNVENVNFQILGIEKTFSNSSMDFCNSHQPNVIITAKKFIPYLKKTLTFKCFLLSIEKENSSTLTLICNQLKRLSQDTKHSHKLDTINLKKKVYIEMLKYNFNPNLCGTQYLLDCILFVKENPYSQLNNFSFKKYFEKLALKYNTTVNTIVWNIHTTIEDMCRANSIDFIKNNYGSEHYITYQTIVNFFKEL